MVDIVNWNNAASKVYTLQAGGRLVTPLELIKQVLTTDWDAERLPYALPPGLVLVS
jgi:hypothetical protein